MIKDSTKQAVVKVLDEIQNAVFELADASKIEFEGNALKYVLGLEVNKKNEGFFRDLVFEYIYEILHGELMDIIKSYSFHEVSVEFTRIAMKIESMIQLEQGMNQDGWSALDGKDMFYRILSVLAGEMDDYSFRIYVNVYERTREFGGHEEGGWYYDWDTCVDSLHVPYADAEYYEEKLKMKHGEGYGNIYSVLGGCEYHYRIEATKAESEDKERPYYC